MHLPIQPVTRPSDLEGQENGHLPSGLMRSVGPSGELHHLAARAFEALRNAARGQGFHLTYTYGGTFRSFENQKALFLRRYTRDFVTGRNTWSHQRTWQGRRWYKLKGVAAAASPGTSNHGWGLAIDLALDYDPSDGIGPDDARYIGPALEWLVANAWRYGFSWEMQSEPWHIRYITGNAVPAAVLDFERNAQHGFRPPAPAADLDDITTWPTVRLGDRGEWVTGLQKLVNSIGADVTVDGHFGPQTEGAVKLLQSMLKITVDGIVGTQTWTTFVQWQAYLASLPPEYPVLRVGSKGVHVSYLQRVLRECQKHVVVDGHFGPQTEGAVKAFQECVKVPADGIVGPVTWEKVLDVGDGFKVARP